MSNGEHSERLAAAEARDHAMSSRLDRIEGKLDRVLEGHADLRVKVAGWSVSIALTISLAANALIEFPDILGG